VGGLLFIGGSDFFKPAETAIVIRFVQGSSMPEITEGSFVTYLGQKVGQVIDSGFVEGVDPDNPAIQDQKFLEVHALVRSDLGLRVDCQVIATGPPLGGKGQLDIHTRGVSKELLSPDKRIYGKVTGFQAIIDELSKELDRSNPEGLLANIKTQLNAEDKSSLVAKIHRSLDDVNATTNKLAAELDSSQDGVFLHKVHRGLDRVNKGLTEIAAMLEENRPRIDRTLASVEGASLKLDEDVMAVLARELELSETTGVSLLTKVHDSFDCIQLSLRDLNVVTDGAKTVVVFNKERINELVQNATDASVHLKRGVKDLGIHPWKLLFQPTTAEKRELHIFNVAREFADAAAHMDDASSRLKSLVEARGGQVQADDPELQDIRSDLEVTIQRFTEAEKALLLTLNIK